MCGAKPGDLVPQAAALLADVEPEERDRTRWKSRLVDALSMHGLLLNPESCELFAQLTAAKMLGIAHRNPRRYFTTNDRQLLKAEEQELRGELEAWLKAVFPRERDIGMFARSHPYMRFGLDVWN